MLLCGLNDLEPGMLVAASVVHPMQPETELLRPGVPLESGIIGRLRQLGVTAVWVDHDATRDLDTAVAPKLSAKRRAVYVQMRRQFKELACATISVAEVQQYRQLVTELVMALIADGRYARMSDDLFKDDSRLFAHCTNVAFLAILVGLEMPVHIVKERSRLSKEEAFNMVALGLGAMFHDIGKTRTSQEARDHYEIRLPNGQDDIPEDYEQHTSIGHEMLCDSRVPASARQAVLNHHQRFDGSGWPDMDEATKSRQRGPQKGNQIHIFSRIVAAANVLDNLLSFHRDNQRPAVAALRDLAEPRFDGWFDPVVRELMIRRIPPFPIGASVTLSDGRKAVVIAPNMEQPCHPAVRILNDESTDQMPGELVDLADCPEVDIHECAGEDVEHYLFELPVAAWRNMMFDRRCEPRQEIDKTMELLLRTEGNGQPSDSFAVRCRSISSRGLGFVHPLFITPGTTCEVTLIGLDGRSVAVSGTVVRCLRRSPKVYGVGVKFDDPIRLENFHTSDENAEHQTV